MKTKIKALLFLGVAILGLSSCNKSDDQPTTSAISGTLAGDSNVVYSTATLSGANQVPAVTTAATGTVSSIFNKTTKMLTSVVTYSGITPVAWHIHKAAAGASGDVVFDLGSTFTSPFEYMSPALTMAQEMDLLDNLNYVNMHTAANPSGEIRAQLTNFVASAGSGTVTGTFDKNSKKMTVKVTYAGITPTAWHIHKGAVGTAGPVVFDLGTAFASPYTYTSVALTATQEADLKAGLYYVNIHTAKNAAGEIRAQLTVK